MKRGGEGGRRTFNVTSGHSSFPVNAYRGERKREGKGMLGWDNTWGIVDVRLFSEQDAFAPAKGGRKGGRRKKKKKRGRREHGRYSYSSSKINGPHWRSPVLAQVGGKGGKKKKKKKGGGPPPPGVGLDVPLRHVEDPVRQISAS